MRCANCKFCLLPQADAMERYNEYMLAVEAGRKKYNYTVESMYLREATYYCRRYPKQREVPPSYWCGEFHDRNH